MQCIRLVCVSECSPRWFEWPDVLTDAEFYERRPSRTANLRGLTTQELIHFRDWRLPAQGSVSESEAPWVLTKLFERSSPELQDWEHRGSPIPDRLPGLPRVCVSKATFGESTSTMAFLFRILVWISPGTLNTLQMLPAERRAQACFEALVSAPPGSRVDVRQIQRIASAVACPGGIA